MAVHGNAYVSESHEKTEEIDRPIGFVHGLRTNQMASIDRVYPWHKSKALTSESAGLFVFMLLDLVLFSRSNIF